MTTASTMLHRHSTDPTDRSMPPVMMTRVIPSAMIAVKVTLRVMLYRFLVVAKLSVESERAILATITAMNTQKVWLASRLDNQLSCFWDMDVVSELVMGSLCERYQTVSMAPVIRPVTSSGELLAMSLSATLVPRRITMTRSATVNTSGIRWLISTTVIP